MLLYLKKKNYILKKVYFLQEMFRFPNKWIKMDRSTSSPHSFIWWTSKLEFVHWRTCSTHSRKDLCSRCRTATHTTVRSTPKNNHHHIELAGYYINQSVGTPYAITFSVVVMIYICRVWFSLQDYSRGLLMPFSWFCRTDPKG